MVLTRSAHGDDSSGTKIPVGGRRRPKQGRWVASMVGWRPGDKIRPDPDSGGPIDLAELQAKQGQPSCSIRWGEADLEERGRGWAAGDWGAGLRSCALPEQRHGVPRPQHLPLVSIGRPVAIKPHECVPPVYQVNERRTEKSETEAVRPPPSLPPPPSPPREERAGSKLPQPLFDPPPRTGGGDGGCVNLPDTGGEIQRWPVPFPVVGSSSPSL